MIAPAYERVSEVGRPADGVSASLGTRAADSLDRLESLDRGVDAPEPQLEQAERFSRKGLQRPVGCHLGQEHRLACVTPAVLFTSHAGLDHRHASQPAADLVVELPSASGAECFDRRRVRGRPVAEPELELGQGAERGRQRRWSAAGCESGAGGHLELEYPGAGAERPEHPGSGVG